MELKKHVITGGPCTGKTTTVEALKKRGFKVIDEIPRIIIDEQNKIGGDLVPWKNLQKFNIAVTKRQLETESMLSEGTHFLDRGLIDALAYCEWGNIEPPEQLKEGVKQVQYHKIFLLEQLPFYKKDDARKESKEDAMKITRCIKKAYQEQGYEVIDVPPFSVEERIEFILKNINATSE